MSWNASWRRWARAAIAWWMLAPLQAAQLLAAQTLAHRGWAGSGIDVAPWWSSAVFYEIDPLAFQDSDGDGFGDLAGIVERLDYLKALGVDAVLLSPYQIVPGTAQTAQQEEDFAHLVSEAGRRQMRVLVDLPLEGGVPGAAVPGVETLLATGRFWLSRGAAGLRVTGRAASPNVAAAVRGLRQLAASFSGERVLLAPAAAGGALGREEPVAYYRAGRRRSHRTSSPQPGNGVRADAQLQVVALERDLPSLSATLLRATLAGYAGRSGIALATDSADRVRSWDRYADHQHDLSRAKLLAAVLLTTRAAPLLLYGQELGMATTPAPQGAEGSPGNPLPMSWGGEKGFSTGAPWIEASRNTATENVTLEDAAPDSLLAWYRRLSVLEHANPALRGGFMQVLETPEPEVVAWLRQAPRSAVLAPPVVVLCNVSGREQVVPLTRALVAAGVGVGATARLRVLAQTWQAASAEAPAPSIAGVVLPPYAVLVAEIAPRPGLEDAPAPYVRSHRRRR